MQWAIFLGIGGVAGWLAGQIMKGSSLGLIRNILVGIVGGVIGGWLFGVLGINIGGGRWLGPILTSAAGACVLLFVIGLFSKKST